MFACISCRCSESRPKPSRSSSRRKESAASGGRGRAGFALRQLFLDPLQPRRRHALGRIFVVVKAPELCELRVPAFTSCTIVTHNAARTKFIAIQSPVPRPHQTRSRPRNLLTRTGFRAIQRRLPRLCVFELAALKVVSYRTRADDPCRNNKTLAGESLFSVRMARP